MTDPADNSQPRSCSLPGNAIPADRGAGPRLLRGRRLRAALYIAADGRCARCGVPLPPGWHADHRLAWSRGGRTDVDQMDALCPECNLRKGAA